MRKFLFSRIHGLDHDLCVRSIVNVPEDELAYANEHLIEREDESEYQDYFKYVMDTLNLQEPGDWREALQLYENLTAIAVD